MITVERCEKQSEWDDEIVNRAGHPLQLWGWGEVKAVHNWRVDRVMLRENGRVVGLAQLLIRSLPKPFTALVYVPRGPVADEQDRGAVLEELASYTKQTYGAVAMTVEPDWATMPLDGKWRRSTNTILIPRTLILDLSKSEEVLLGDMSKKTRQYIRKSATEKVEIRQVRGREELAKCLVIYRQTAERAGFELHNDQYYYDVYEKLGEHSPVFAVFQGDEPLAFLWLAISSETAFELYGGMNEDGQRLRVNYALKWHAIQTMKKWGINRYDFNGLLNDGVSTFKQGFASHETMLAGTYDIALSPLYAVWSKGLPMAKKIIRTIKKR